MENNTDKFRIISVVLSLVVVALVILVVWQQRKISRLEGGQAFFAAKTSSFDQTKAINDSLSATKAIIGTVVSSTASQIVIKTSLVDLNALATFDFKKSQTLPTTDKNLTIKITKDTTISGQIADGGSVTVQTKESVYGDGDLTAISINTSAPRKISPATGQ
jgi:hypothetical protein